MITVSADFRLFESNCNGIGISAKNLYRSHTREELAESRRRTEQRSEAADDLKSRLAEERKAREEAARQSGSKDSSISRMADAIASLEKQVAQMTSEKDDLLVKVPNQLQVIIFHKFSIS